MDDHLTEGCAVLPPEIMAVRAAEAAAFLKALSHEGRLMILCHLSAAERTVTEIEALLGLRQAAVSQQLARLRAEGLVAARRDGKAIYYSIRDPKVRATMGLVYDLFCGPSGDPSGDPGDASPEIAPLPKAKGAPA